MLIADGFEFPTSKAAEDYIIFLGDLSTDICKAIVMLLRTQRAKELIDGVRPFLLDNYPIATCVYTAKAVQKGKVLKLEGLICSWMKKLILLGVPLQQILWLIVLCLMAHGLTQRSAYLDDEGATKRLINVNSPDFQIRVEFFSKEDAVLGVNFFHLALALTKPSLFEGKTVHDSIMKSLFVLKGFQIKSVQDTHKLRLLLKTREISGPMWRLAVEEETGSTSKARATFQIEHYLLTFAPHIQYDIIEPECYPGGNVNYNYWCSLYWTMTDDNSKAMLA
eukprot:91051-Rhodomonas_salina.1